MTGNDLHCFFQRLNPDLWLTKTCDGFKYGDPTTKIKSIAVTWMATIQVIETAISHGHNFILTHEPTFYNHWDRIDELQDDITYKKKIDYLSRNRIVVYRLHDTWDTFDTYGIVDSWAVSLNFENLTASDGRHKVYEIPPVPLVELAERIKQRMKLRSIRIEGKFDAVVTKIGLGIGAWGGMTNLKA